MSRNDRQEMQERQPRDPGFGLPTGGGLGAPPYVRLTQRERPPRGRRSVWTLVAVVIAAHVLLAWVAYIILRPVPYHPDERDVFQVTLIEPESALPPPPPLLAPPPLPGQPPAPAAPRHLHPVPPAKGAISATLEGAKGTPLELYGPNGQIRVPSGSQPAAPAPAYSTPEITGSHIYSGKSPIPYQPTRFNKDWAPVNQSLGGKLIDKAIDKTTIKKTIKLPGGIKIRCAANPLLIFAGGLLGCGGMPPPPPPKNDNDIRLSMPPPETLTGKKVPLPKSASSAAPASAGSS